MGAKRFYKIPSDAFAALQLDAGVLLANFDIEAAAADDTNPGYTDADLICATTGGINVVATPTFSDLGEDVDNVPLNMKEFKHLDSWECSISTTSLGTSARTLKMALGCADISEDGKSIIPRMALNQKDFTDMWWVGEKANGGFVAVHIFNALSTSGLSLQTGKNAKGTTELTLTGHVSINAQDVVPMLFYSIDPVSANTFTVSFNTDGGTEIESQEVESGGKATRPATDPTKEHYTFGGWYADSAKITEFDFDTQIIYTDTVVYAKFTIDTFTVTFDTDGGSDVDSQTIAYGGKVTKPADPTKTGETFDDWYEDDLYTTPFDFVNTTITADTTIYAKFTA